jgi:hypothetical protein
MKLNIKTLGQELSPIFGNEFRYKKGVQALIWERENGNFRELIILSYSVYSGIVLNHMSAMVVYTEVDDLIKNLCSKYNVNYSLYQGTTSYSFHLNIDEGNELINSKLFDQNIIDTSQVDEYKIELTQINNRIIQPFFKKYENPQSVYEKIKTEGIDNDSLVWFFDGQFTYAKILYFLKQAKDPDYEHAKIHLLEKHNNAVEEYPHIFESENKVLQEFIEIIENKKEEPLNFNNS